MSNLANALFTKTQQQVLGLIYTNPTKSFYTKEILRLTGMGVATIKRELDRMVAAGILTLEKIGNQHHYQANPDCPIYSELLAIVRKTFGIADILQKTLSSVKGTILFSFIYGSIAKGTDKSNSDIDLMLIGNKLNYGNLMDKLISVEGKLGRTINPTIYSVKEFNKKMDEKNSFLTRVMKQEKIIVTGTIHDIRES